MAGEVKTVKFKLQQQSSARSSAIQDRLRKQRGSSKGAELPGSAAGARMSSREVAQVANQLRQQTASVCHRHVRSVKYEVARLREHLLKLEDEVKLLSRGKNSLEIAIQEFRKAISANQQSLALQQKKIRTNDHNCIKTLQKEAEILSKMKHSIESHLHTIKSHLLKMDALRKTLHQRISTLSRGPLHLDAQCYQVYEGPTGVQGRGRGYGLSQSVPAPAWPNTGDSESIATAQLCSSVSEAISSSSNLKAELRSLLVTAQARKAEEHDKVTAAIAGSLQETQTHKQTLILEKGQVRMAQNTMLHQRHSEEIALGIAQGPVSDKHRSVSERHERPLSRLRPASAVEEKANFKHSMDKLTRQLSATCLRASRAGDNDQLLSRQMKEQCVSSALDWRTRRLRQAALDNRWMM